MQAQCVYNKFRWLISMGADEQCLIRSVLHSPNTQSHSANNISLRLKTTKKKDENLQFFFSVRSLKWFAFLGFRLCVCSDKIFCTQQSHSFAINMAEPKNTHSLFSKRWSSRSLALSQSHGAEAETEEKTYIYCAHQILDTINIVY